MNLLFVALLLSLLSSAILIGVEARRRHGHYHVHCPRGESKLGVKCGRSISVPCPGSSYCFPGLARQIATCCCNDTAATCPDCTRPVNCLVDPCEMASCPLFPNATCRADFCGGCNARFFIRRREVTDQCKRIKPCSRSGGRDISVDCGRGTSVECPGDSYCDIHPKDKFATCCCNDTVATCPDCTQPVSCLINPCEGTSCPAFPDATCRADYCGGCNARFFVESGQRGHEVTAKCQK